MKSGAQLKKIKSLKVDLHKSKTKDHNEKDAEIRGRCLTFSGAKLHKIKSQDQLEMQLKEIKSQRTKLNFC